MPPNSQTAARQDGDFVRLIGLLGKPLDVEMRTAEELAESFPARRVHVVNSGGAGAYLGIATRLLLFKLVQLAAA